MDKETILKERKQWYSQIFGLWEIAKVIKNRELAFLKAKDEEVNKRVRYLFALNIDSLKRHFEWFGFMRFKVNMYHSVSFMPQIPMFNMDLRNRRKDENYQYFDKNYHEFVKGFNFFIDLDGKEDFKKCHQEAKELKKLFDKHKLPYYIINSSKNGFHFQIPHEYMPKDIKYLLTALNNVVYNLKGIYMFDCIDDSVIDLKRICKCLKGNMPVIIKENGIIKTVTLEELDKRFINNDFQSIKKIENIEILSYNKNKLKTEWDKLEYIIRTKFDNGNINEVKTEQGYYTEITKNHPLLKYNNKKEFIFTEKINPDDSLLSPKISLNGNIKEIDLLEYLIPLKDKYKIFCKLSKNIKKEINKKNMHCYKKRKFRNSEWILLNDLISLNINLDLIKEFRINSQKSLSRYLKFNKYLFRLFGFYVSEGHFDKSRRGFSINIGKDEANFVIECFKKLNIRYNVYKLGNVITLTPSHRLLGIIISEILNSGKSSSYKRIPFIVFNTSKENQLEFLKAYIIGDGNICRKRISMTTISEMLANDLIILLKGLDFSPFLKKRKPKKLVYNKYKAKEQFIIYFSFDNALKDKKDLFNNIIKPIKKNHYSYNMIPNKILNNLKNKMNIKYNQHIINSFKSKKYNKDFSLKLLRYLEKNKKERWGDNWHNYNFAKKIIKNNEIGFSKVKKIEKKKQKIKFVYDLSTKKNHNFISGIGNIVHHNCPYSYECSGCICLPLSDYQFENFRQDMITFEGVQKYVKIKNRGLLIRKHGLTDEELTNNVSKFITSFS